LTKRLEAANLRLRFARIRHQHELLQQRLAKCGTAALMHARRRYEPVHAHLTQLSPLAILSRGYAIVSNAENHVIRTAGQVSTGEALGIRLYSGTLTAAVISKNEDKPS
jgi:exodeoxyribonuclease VII large subunit